MKRRSLSILLCAAALMCAAGYASADIWARGSIHCHSTNSDGNVSPQEVMDWYKDHGFQFVILTDHRKVTDVGPLDKPGDSFIAIHGEELDLNWKSLPIHANALGLMKTVTPPGPKFSPGRSVANLVEFIRETGAIPMVNHPNWYSALNHRDLRSISGPWLLEIANMGGPTSYNEGSTSVLSVEQTWDILLSEGRTVYGAATDDSHDYKVFKPGNANPGLGWVVCRVPELTTASVLDALRTGRFYSSTGVEITDYRFDGRTMKVGVAPKEGQTFVIRFVGRDGRILQETPGLTASCTVKGTPERNDYIRCKVICSDRTVAWTQAEKL